MAELVVDEVKHLGWCGCCCGVVVVVVVWLLWWCDWDGVVVMVMVWCDSGCCDGGCCDGGFNIYINQQLD